MGAGPSSTAPPRVASHCPSALGMRRPVPPSKVRQRSPPLMGEAVTPRPSLSRQAPLQA